MRLSEEQKSRMTHHEVDGAADFLGLHLVSFHAVPAEGRKSVNFFFSDPIIHVCKLKSRFYETCFFCEVEILRFYLGKFHTTAF